MRGNEWYMGVGIWLSAGGCGCARARLAGWLLWPDTALLRHCLRFQHKGNEFLLNGGSDFNPAVELQVCFVLREGQLAGWRRPTPPSSPSTFKNIHPQFLLVSPHLILFVLVETVTQNPTGQGNNWDLEVPDVFSRQCSSETASC